MYSCFYIFGYSFGGSGFLFFWGSSIFGGLGWGWGWGWTVVWVYFIGYYLLICLAIIIFFGGGFGASSAIFFYIIWGESCSTNFKSSLLSIRESLGYVPKLF